MMEAMPHAPEKRWYIYIYIYKNMEGDYLPLKKGDLP